MSLIIARQPKHSTRRLPPSFHPLVFFFIRSCPPERVVRMSTPLCAYHHHPQSSIRDDTFSVISPFTHQGRESPPIVVSYHLNRCRRRAGGVVKWCRLAGRENIPCSRPPSAAAAAGSRFGSFDKKETRRGSSWVSVCGNRECVVGSLVSVPPSVCVHYWNILSHPKSVENTFATHFSSSRFSRNLSGREFVSIQDHW